MAANAKDELARFLAFLGEHGERADFAEQVARLRVPDDLKALLLAHDRAGLQQRFADGSRAFSSYIYVSVADDPD
jgi:hypothetical protein